MVGLCSRFLPITCKISYHLPHLAHFVSSVLNFPVPESPDLPTMRLVEVGWSVMQCTTMRFPAHSPKLYRSSFILIGDTFSGDAGDKSQCFSQNLIICFASGTSMKSSSNIMRPETGYTCSFEKLFKRSTLHGHFLRHGTRSSILSSRNLLFATSPFQVR